MQKTLAASTGTFNAVAPGSAVSGGTVFLGKSFLKVQHLSAKCVVLAETDTFTIAARWQVSDDASAWVNCAHAPQNPASVVLATGTAGADAAVTINVPAPDVYGWQYARLQLVAGGTTGATADTYSIAYHYIQVVGAAAAQ